MIPSPNQCCPSVLNEITEINIHFVIICTFFLFAFVIICLNCRYLIGILYDKSEYHNIFSTIYHRHVTRVTLLYKYLDKVKITVQSYILDQIDRNLDRNINLNSSHHNIEILSLKGLTALRLIRQDLDERVNTTSDRRRLTKMITRR